MNARASSVENPPPAGIIQSMKNLHSMSLSAAALRHAGALVMLLTPAAALCQDGYKAPERAKDAPWLAILYTAVFFVGVLVVAFKHARRTHLD